VRNIEEQTFDSVALSPASVTGMFASPMAQTFRQE
jgi:hypothetical protein